ncbi:phage integrase family [Arthrobacter sp. Hiyo6]|nr:phage integrase family [Arthrobacter sp. Hiyo6]
MQFESHLGHSVFPGQRGLEAQRVHKKLVFCAPEARTLGMASIWERKKLDGSTSFTVRWRNPETRKQEGITLATSAEAQTLKRLLDANKQSFEIAQHAMVKNQTKSPTVAAVIQEHIDLLVRPSVGTVHTYQTMLKLHIEDVIGHIPVDKLDYRHLTYWIKTMQKKGRSPKTIKNNHGLIYAAMETAVMLRYRKDDPCRGVQGLAGTVTAMAGGYSNTCAVENCAAYCWGEGDLGTVYVDASTAISVGGTFAAGNKTVGLWTEVGSAIFSYITAS